MLKCERASCGGKDCGAAVHGRETVGKMEKFSVKKPFTVLVAVVMVLILGFVAITKMQTNLLPEYELPDVDNRDLLLLIQLAVEKMPGQRQRIFRMSREEGIANDEIARRLGISTRTVENQISRALSELRKLVTLILFFF